MLSHLGQAKSCRWYRKGKNRDLSAYSKPQIIWAAAQTNVAQQGSSQDGEGGIDEDAPDFDDIMERHNLFELVPPGDEPDLHGASSSAGPSIPWCVLLPPSLNDDEDTRVIDELAEELAGRVVRMSEAVVEK